VFFVEGYIMYWCLANCTFIKTGFPVFLDYDAIHCTKLVGLWCSLFC
jgi:predicted Abi (CAAX) family protease